jgi:hypothetical protein
MPVTVTLRAAEEVNSTMHKRSTKLIEMRCAL